MEENKEAIIAARKARKLEKAAEKQAAAEKKKRLEALLEEASLNGILPPIQHSQDDLDLYKFLLAHPTICDKLFHNLIKDGQADGAALQGVLICETLFIKDY